MLVDDDTDLLGALRDALDDEYEIVTCSSGEEAVRRLELVKTKVTKLDAVICDMRMPGLQGTDVLKEVIKCNELMPRILLTGFTDLEAAKAAVNEGRIHHYESKPVEMTTLKQVLSKELALYEERKAIAEDAKLKNKALDLAERAIRSIPVPRDKK